jgi:two-component system response regulator FixJ
MDVRRRMVHILDDDPAVRQMLACLLRIAGYAAVIYETSYALLNALAAIEPGCLLLDVRLPYIDGLTLQKRLGQSALAVIPMTGDGDVDMAVRAMRAGAVDFLEKPFTEARLIAALDSGFASLSPGMRDFDGGEEVRRIATLSARECQVLEGLAGGLQHKAIAYQLGISVRTVEVHRAHMLRRLGVSHLADALRLRILAGLAG